MPLRGAKANSTTALARGKGSLNLSWVHEWDISSAASGSKSVTSRLCAEAVKAFKGVLREVHSHKDLSRSTRHRLEKSCSTLTLWAAGYGVRDGELDEALAKSWSLRRSVLELLMSIGKVLTERLIPRLGLRDNASIDVYALKAATADASAALSEDRRCRNRNTSNLDNDGSSSSSAFSSGAESNDFEDALEDIANAVRCLLDLDPLIRAPVADRNKWEELGERAVPISWSPHQLYSDRIAHRFPKAHNELVNRLAKANLDRFQRMQDERRKNACAEQQPELNMTEADRASRTQGSTKFNDSGVGTSIHTASAYAETTMSYRQNESHSVRVPPLPIEAKRGMPFECVACSRTVAIKSNSAWKKHLYMDLKPWVCHDIACQQGDEPFASRQDWVNHLAQVHDFEGNSASINCPLCQEAMPEGKLKIVAHLASHMEEISLAALPATAGSDAESSSNGAAGDSDSSADPITRRHPKNDDDVLYHAGDSARRLRRRVTGLNSDISGGEMTDVDEYFGEDDENALHQAEATGTHPPNESLRFVCRDPATAGLSSSIQPVKPLSACASCRNNKQWTWRSAAANHLRRSHFKPAVKGKEKSKSKSAYAIGSSLPSTMALNAWIDVVELGGKAEEKPTASSFTDFAPKTVKEKAISEDGFIKDSTQDMLFQDFSKKNIGTSHDLSVEAFSRDLDAIGQEVPISGSQQSMRTDELPLKIGRTGFEFLEGIFDVNQDPSSDEMSQFSQQLGIKTTEIIDWFRAKRMMARKQQQASGSPTSNKQNTDVFSTNAEVSTTPTGGGTVRDHPLYKDAAPMLDGLYHCPWEGEADCNHKPEKIKCNYDKFVDYHLKPYRCNDPACEGPRFSSTACLLRHGREAHAMHGAGDKPFLCSHDGCDRALPGNGFPHQWNLRDHMRRVHGDRESQISSAMKTTQEPEGVKRRVKQNATLPLPLSNESRRNNSPTTAASSPEPVPSSYRSNSYVNKLISEVNRETYPSKSNRNSPDYLDENTAGGPAISYGVQKPQNKFTRNRQVDDDDFEDLMWVGAATFSLGETRSETGVSTSTYPDMVSTQAKSSSYTPWYSEDSWPQMGQAAARDSSPFPWVAQGEPAHLHESGQRLLNPSSLRPAAGNFSEQSGPSFVSFDELNGMERRADGLPNIGKPSSPLLQSVEDGFGQLHNRVPERNFSHFFRSTDRRLPYHEEGIQESVEGHGDLQSGHLAWKGDMDSSYDKRDTGKPSQLIENTSPTMVVSKSYHHTSTEAPNPPAPTPSGSTYSAAGIQFMPPEQLSIGLKLAREFMKEHPKKDFNYGNVKKATDNVSTGNVHIGCIQTPAADSAENKKRGKQVNGSVYRYLKEG